MQLRSRLASSSMFSLFLTMLLLAASATLSAQTGATLYTFTGTPDGAWPEGGLTVGPDGAFYGPTQYGGANTFGTVFRVSQTNGTWSESIIYSFADVNDGAGPIGPITFDAAGNIYGTTAFGMPYEKGTVFKLSPGANGWTPTLLYGFTGGADGNQPETGVTFDKAGNIYGTTYFGGTGYGVLYKLAPNADGSWSESVIHTFGAYTGDALFPSSGVLIDAAGNLYGAAYEGGANFKGAIYQFSPNADGSWTENILYSFTGKADGAAPNSLIFDKLGNLYGSAGGGGIRTGVCDTGVGGCGTIFRLAPSAGGTYTLNRLYSFDGTTGETPTHLAFDSAGNLYGTTQNGGANNSGVTFELKRGSTGQRWTYSTLYQFGGTTNTGIEPSGIIVNKDHLYGTTISTETCYLCGTVWEVTP